MGGEWPFEAGREPDVSQPGDIAVEHQNDAIEAPPPARTVNAAPRVRTLLVCDLADSTALVERLGDSAAAELLRRHDRLARSLMQRHGGREIDKTDGFLVLFERPVEAVSFALGYQRALRTLTQETGHPMRARIGVHMGEVVVWENAAAEVAEGAKPFDVEGLAKPVAARLMALALPGQTLLSGVAFSLAQRAERDVQSETPVRWLTHGRYRFKGVPTPMLVHEAGESGFAPLTAPPSSGKAEREMPLWRKPGMIMLEAIALIAAIAVPVVLSLRAPPAIAFGERDWVVVGDLRNLTGEDTLQESLETAFRISLEQSRYVNVLPDLKLRDTLARMQRAPDTVVDRAVASEIALREGARAVILPTVAEIGGRVRVSAEVIDPSTQTTVYAESADGVGAPSALDSIDTVTQELRARLGEAMKSIENDSAPLPRVTSGNIDALRAYSLAAQAQGQARPADARLLYQRALDIDPEFALAHLGLARVAMGQTDRATALRHAQRAIELRERLTARDRLYVDAWQASFGPPSEAMGKWKLLAEMYPDYFAGPYNYAIYAGQHANLYAESLPYLERALSPQNPLRNGAHYTMGWYLTAQERFDEAAKQFESANSLGDSAGGEMQAGLALARGRPDEARAILDRATRQADDAQRALSERTHGLLEIDAGNLSAAVARFDAARGSKALDAKWRDQFAVLSLSTAAAAPDADFARRALAFIESQRNALADAENVDRDHVLFLTLLTGYVGARSGAADVASAALALAEAPALTSGYPNIEAMARIVRAELLRAGGDAESAITLLVPMLDGAALYQTHSAALRAFRAAGRDADALAQADWLATHRGRALTEWGNVWSQSALNVIDARLALLERAELLQTLGRAAEASSALDEFERAWQRPPSALADRSRALRARLRG